MLNGCGYDENNHPILHSMSDIIKSYSDTKVVQPTNKPMLTVAFDASNDNDFQPQEIQHPEGLIALPIHKPSTNPSTFLEPTNTGTIPQFLSPPLQPQSTTQRNFPKMIVPMGDKSIDSAEDNAVSGGETA
jgi:hypothetical protein